MKKNYLYYHSIVCGAALMLVCCHAANKQNLSSEEATAIVTPVTVTSIGSGAMEETIELNATSVFRQKWIVKSNVNGYLQRSSVQLNQEVNSGQVLFTLKTKEAESIGNTINILDSSFRFSGINSIRANGSGFISELNHQAGDYVQDGEQLAVVTDTKSFVFLLDLPYEMRPYVNDKGPVQLVLPDGEKMQANVSGSMPVMDSSSQTQRVILKVNADHPIPENLIAKVQLIKTSHPNSHFLPKEAILTDESQANFWVMKMISDSLAARVEIKKGIESGNKVEILSPLFSDHDKILISGNFGLPDTASVRVVTSTGDK